MIDNPYQLIIININGEIIKTRHIAPEEAKMNENEFTNFNKKFSRASQYLQSNKRIYKINSYYFIDFFSMNMPVFLGKEAFGFLLKYETANHLSNNISSTVTNFIYWFNEKNPNARFNYRDNELYSINILDPENIFMEILIHEKMPTEQQRLNDISLSLASVLFPHEQWIPTEANIWVAKSRLVEEYREPEKWEREMSQVRILTGRGSVAYFLPERPIRGKTSMLCADLVLDGTVTEMKTTSGTRATLEPVSV